MRDRLTDRYVRVAVRYRQRFHEEPPPLPPDLVKAVNTVQAMVAKLNNRAPLTIQKGPGMIVEDKVRREEDARKAKES